MLVISLATFILLRITPIFTSKRQLQISNDAPTVSKLEISIKLRKAEVSKSTKLSIVIIVFKSRSRAERIPISIR